MHPSYINSNGNTSFSAINQQRMASLSYYNNETLINLEIATNMQPTMENISTYNNGKFLESDSGINRFNSHLILENKRLTGNRSSKKDRHSKIDTARGPRDRRMRLSLDVAKRFFKLQDMLGFDKASNTVQWLLMKSKAAIQDLSPQQINIKKSCSQLMGVSSKSPSSASECEVLSVLIDDQSIYQNSGKDQVITTTNKGKISSCSSNKKKSTILAKEIREKARARARKRTTEKRNSKLGNDGGEGGDQYSKPRPSVDQDDQNTNRLGFWIPFAEDQVDLTDQAHEYPSSHFGDNTSMMSSDWSPSFLFNNQQNLEPCHEHQLISDFQILDKPWEGNIKN